jgi:hypothetical protein
MASRVYPKGACARSKTVRRAARYQTNMGPGRSAASPRLARAEQSPAAGSRITMQHPNKPRLEARNLSNYATAITEGGGNDRL